MIALWLLALEGCDPVVDKVEDTSISGQSNTLVMTDGNNYSYTGGVVVESVPVTMGRDAVVDWSALSLDLRDEAIGPAEVTRLDLVAFRGTMEDVLVEISTNQLDQSDVASLCQFENGADASWTSLSSFIEQGNAFNPTGELVERSGISSWAILVERESGGRSEIATMVFLTLVEDDGQGTITIDNDSARLNFSATLGQPLTAQEGVDYTLDWSQITTDGSGQDFNSARVNQLFVGHVSEADAGAIETNFVHLIESSDAIYGVNAYGASSAALSDCVDAEGTPFPGFTSDGTWLIGLSCLACSSPAPLMLGYVALN